MMSIIDDVARLIASYALFILKPFYPILRLVADFYFAVIELLFKSRNSLPFCRGERILWPARDDPLLCISAKAAAEKIISKQITSQELVRAYIDRIQKVNPIINAIASQNFERAVAQAKTADAFLMSEDNNIDELVTTKPLFGVPFTCKDNLLVKGLYCFAGDPLNILKDISTRDAEVIRRLREAGAILLTTSNMAESMETENDVFGRTNNPYDSRRTAGGSSGGEGALVASAGSPFGIGNDLGGSIRVPATFCGVFGLKPTAELVPLDGLISSLTDNYRWTIGPLCRYSEDISLIMDVISGTEGQAKMNEFLPENFKLESVRMFYLLELKTILSQRPSKGMRRSVDRAVKYFEKRYSTVPQMVDFPLIHHVFELWAVMRYKSNEEVPSVIKSLLRVIKDTIWLLLGRIGKAQATFFELGLDFVGIFLAPRTNEEREFLTNKVNTLRQQIIALLGNDGVLVFPAFPTSAPWHHQPKFTVFNGAYTTLFNYLGLPALVCPMGLDEATGMPLSVQLVGAPYSEKLLCAVATELERGFGGWTPQS